MALPENIRGAAQTVLGGAIATGRMRAFRILKSGVLTIPSPALLSILSGRPVAIAGTACLTLAGLLLLIWPGGFLGLSLCALVWAGSLCLGACGLQIAEYQRHVDMLEDEMAGLRETRQLWERDLLNRVKTEQTSR